MPHLLSRRAALGGALAVPILLSACTADDATPATDPDRTALEAALEVEVGLSSVVGNLQASSGRAGSEPLLAVDRHIEALDTALGQAASATARPERPGAPAASQTPSQLPPSSLDDAVRAADHAVNAHNRALRDASAEITPLIASIAASDAAIAAFLRGGSP